MWAVPHAYQPNRTGCPKTIKMNFGAIKKQNFRLGGTLKS